MVIKISPATNEVITIIPAGSMTSNRAHKVASILNKDELAGLLNGVDAQATRNLFEDYLCNDLDIGCYITHV